MSISLKYKSTQLNLHATHADNDICILFLSGGSIDTGKERFHQWQDDLQRMKISSVSFDYSDVNGSGELLHNSSLQKRIAESVYVSDWMKENIRAQQYILYGVSMGGCIALGLINERPGTFSKLVLHAPAAYSAYAHTLCFGKEFTDEIRKEGNWRNSPAFQWFKQYTNPTLFIKAENDEVIPHEIIKRYQSIKKEQNDFEVITLKDAQHSIWGDTSTDIKLRSKVYKSILYFIDKQY